ncbi:hypothetical protein S40285_07916 [Stachybotrys chlorohalonatus IBT 40285]|uniref:Uncharacterized protein n=1 Tax=Stachybotrys chlorohalonatus (strain IBT 40285) TaxID=1283841 RepID=A0A084QDF1_STAC4|nr:hypothetical protein S40285_07916 [Stachybotrys chlorohalonata IBT 40285]
MPGTFQVEATGLFRPPAPHHSNSGFVHTLSRTPTDSNPKRKRDYDATARPYDVATPDIEYPSDGPLATPFTKDAHRRYVFGGELTTPSCDPFDEAMGESMFSDSDYRRALGTKRSRNEMDDCTLGPTQLFDLPPYPRPAQRWGLGAFAAIGGVVGRVLDFCTIGAFRGFYAGGGKTYAVEAPTSEAEGLGRNYLDDKDQHRVPGGFPPANSHDHELVQDPDYIHESRASTPTRPAAKRRQTGQSDDLGRNWVIVNEPVASTGNRKPPRPPLNRNLSSSVTTGRRRSTPTSRISSTSTSSGPRRPASRLSTAHAPPVCAAPRPVSSASYASPRSPSPSKIPRPLSSSNVIQSSPVQPSSHSRRRSTMAPAGGSPSFTHRRTNSAASAASFRAPSKTDNADASPRLDAEAKHLAARRRKEERDNDVRLGALSKQLQDMIRQGKEALGTKIEIDSMDVEWEDDEASPRFR